jgi:hypothetical protein
MRSRGRSANAGFTRPSARFADFAHRRVGGDGMLESVRPALNVMERIPRAACERFSSTGITQAG